MSPFSLGAKCRLFHLGRNVAFYTWGEMSPFLHGVKCRAFYLGAKCHGEKCRGFKEIN